MQVVHDAPATVSESVARDEALLRAGLATVRVAVIRDRAASFGVGTPRDGTSEAAARRHGLPTVRRSTGGTGLLHLPGDLVWSVVLPRTDPRVGPDFSSAYGRLGSGAVMFLADLEVDARWAEPLALSDEFCPLGRRGRALTVAGRAIGGAAQHLTATTLLHHGVISRTVDRSLVETVFGLSPEVASQRLASLTELGVTDDPEDLADALATAISASLGGTSPA